MAGSQPQPSRSDDSVGDLEDGSIDDLDTDEDSRVVVGEYTWADFMAEQGYDDEAEVVLRDVEDDRDDDRPWWDFGLGKTSEDSHSQREIDWTSVSFDPESYLGFHPEELRDRLELVTAVAGGIWEYFKTQIANTPVVKDEYTWEHFKWEYYYEEDGDRPRDEEGRIEPFDPEAYLGFEPDDVESMLSEGGRMARTLLDLEERRTVNVNPNLDEDEFFSERDGTTTVTNRYDLEKAVAMEKKLEFEEIDRYWVNKPYAFVIVFHSVRENEKKYYLVDPYLNEIEESLVEFLTGKLRTAIKYSDDEVVIRGTIEERSAVIERETRRLLDRYSLFSESESIVDVVVHRARSLLGLIDDLDDVIGASTDDDEKDAETSTADDEDSVEITTGDDAEAGIPTDDDAEITTDDVEEAGTPTANGEEDTVTPTEGVEEDPETAPDDLDGIEARPEPAVLAEDPETVTEYQVVKLLYVLTRNFIGYGRIDGIKHDINVEDISCDGYNSRVFVYHTDYENLITNVSHGESELDNFVVKLAQRSGKGISKRRPQVDATLPDGSRAQLTLGSEVSDHGTNYTIRQFNDVPFTPIDLINWHTFSLDQMAFLWLCIENNKSLIFSGGTASGKTTSLNAVSLFIPSNTKIVSIEDTREVELPQRNWVASITRPAFTEDGKGDIDEFDLLEAALRQRPDYIIMGEVRGEEGRTLFQVMSTGHTTLTTFHADSVGEVLKRFTTDPINVSKTMFTAIDLVSVQTQTRVRGRKVRRNKVITEINHYDTENDEINVQDVFQWQPETDEYQETVGPNVLEDIQFDQGWSRERTREEVFKRKVVLAYLIENDLNEYAQVAATLQAFINDPETILTLISRGQLEKSLSDLQDMESVTIDVQPEKEKLVPRPDPTSDTADYAAEILEEAESRLFETYREKELTPLVSALPRPDEAEDVVAEPGRGRELLERHAASEGTESIEVADGGTERSTTSETTESDRRTDN